MSKIIYQPLKPFHINQEFGANRACVSTDGENFVITCDGHNPPDGFRSLYGKKGHRGLDLKAWHGQEVYCAQEGVVTWIDTDPKSGLDVRIESSIDGREIMHIYEHLLGYQPQLGQRVKTGQIIGWADNTGYSSGDHLHFEVREWIDGKWVSIDPLTIMEPIFAKDIMKLNDTLAYLKEQVALLADRVGDFIRNKV